MSIEIPLKAKYLDRPKGLQKSGGSVSGVKKIRKKLTGPQAKAQREITTANRRELWIVNGKKQWRSAT
jgi:hypothetical protein